MGFRANWGFRANRWQGQRGEYWVVAQAILIIGYAVLPVYRPVGWHIPAPPALYGVWTIAAALALFAVILIGKGLRDLGHNLTPLPYPKADGELVQTGVYGIVRHPLYSGLIFAAIAWAIYQVSLSHFGAAPIALVFLNAKASREESWLAERYPEYPDYQHRVKKLIPWIY
jgi:protein-S-isoprenylcysteine O-methyltransferase Ste14